VVVVGGGARAAGAAGWLLADCRYVADAFDKKLGEGGESECEHAW
jgi:hypothetical protein